MTAAGAMCLFHETRIARFVSYVVYVAYAARGVPSEGARKVPRVPRWAVDASPGPEVSVGGSRWVCGELTFASNHATTAAPAATPIDADASLSLLLRLHPPPALVPISRRYELLQLVWVVNHRDDQRARRTMANLLARAKLLGGDLEEVAARALVRERAELRVPVHIL